MKCLNTRPEEADDDEEIIYKIEIPANRYDLLCLEVLAQALRVFNKKQEIPTYSLADISKDKIIKMQVKPDTSKIRPYVVCAVLRGVTFDEARYNSFIDLQDKLHQNICGRRSLVAIGTHYLDTLQGPFTYEKILKEEIESKSLNHVLVGLMCAQIVLEKRPTMSEVVEMLLNESKEKMAQLEAYPLFNGNNGIEAVDESSEIILEVKHHQKQELE